MGWKDLHIAGDEILEVENEKQVRMVMRYREAEKAAQMAQEHKIAADKKHEEYLKVSFSIKGVLINRFRLESQLFIFYVFISL
jgi:hypothetical protein